MPILRITNWDFVRSGELAVLGAKLIETCIAANIHGIESADVITVVDGGRRIMPRDRVLIIEVVGLFAKPERTLTDRQRLADALATCASKFVLADEAVEVLVNRFDPSAEAFARIERR